MGVYFIAAGSSSKNREKTLDIPHSVEEMCQFLSPRDCDRLKRYFPNGQGVYLWGANEKNANDVFSIRGDEYVVDVKNKEVIQVFRFCFAVKTQDTRLQEYVGWDREKPKDKRRPYRYVYFLKSPVRTTKTQKKYFQNALGQGNNRTFLFGQAYFGDREIEGALKLTGSGSVEDFLGIRKREERVTPSPCPGTPPEKTLDVPRLRILVWLSTLVRRIRQICHHLGRKKRGA